MVKKVSSGAQVIDSLLAGGIEPGIITTFCGGAGTGKSNICILATVRQLEQGKKVIFVDTEASFSIERAKQISPNYEKNSDNLFLFNPVSFEEQKKIFTDILRLSTKDKKISLIIIDSIAMLYRLHLGASKEAYETNREMARQLRILSEIARKNNIPVLITNQIYADFENKESVKMVGGELIKYWSKAIILLEYLQSGLRTATIVKHRSLKDREHKTFEIIESGLEESKRRFSFF